MITNQQNNTIDNRYRQTDYPDIWGSRHKVLKQYVQKIRWQGGNFSRELITMKESFHGYNFQSYNWKFQ